jgi:hypothetical protein
MLKGSTAMFYTQQTPLINMTQNGEKGKEECIMPQQSVSLQYHGMSLFTQNLPIYYRG